MANRNDANTKYTELYEQMVKLSHEELAQKYVELQMQADQYVDELSKFSERKWIVEPLVQKVVPVISERRVQSYEYMIQEKFKLIEPEEIVRDQLMELNELRIEAIQCLAELEKGEEFKLKDQKKEHKSKNL
jgi:hypothetical protein